MYIFFYFDEHLMKTDRSTFPDVKLRLLWQPQFGPERPVQYVHTSTSRW